jgi:hypothetical protein
MSFDMEQYTRTFSSFAGADIVATFNGRLIGELQAITYSVVREVAPIYTMGSPDPRAYSRNKRGISGSMIFTMFDRDALMEEMKKSYEGAPDLMTFQQYQWNVGAAENQILSGLQAAKSTGGYGIETWDEQMTKLGYGAVQGQQGFSADGLTGFYVPEYADQLMPFNIAITGANEFGQRMGMELYGIQILNSGSGFSVDDVVAATAYTFVARKIKGVERKANLRTTGQSSANTAAGESYQIV